MSLFALEQFWIAVFRASRGQLLAVADSRVAMDSATPLRDASTANAVEGSSRRRSPNAPPLYRASNRSSVSGSAGLVR